ncbi:hypothetical protein CFELI_05900 [Corynebacterium felinum]|uniref:Uncharacterized protein n=1 Tax=Corynebacterium felinum TaxID=131318 RepID=A0ABU2BAX8_9CORY|nr:hypothetical protein [Corynebacterium felinum]WJY94802.1 hypothetical protein CFELI_05900 [Corynebacterium felinum]
MVTMEGLVCAAVLTEGVLFSRIFHIFVERACLNHCVKGYEGECFIPASDAGN